MQLLFRREWDSRVLLSGSSSPSDSTQQSAHSSGGPYIYVPLPSISEMRTWSVQVLAHQVLRMRSKHLGIMFPLAAQMSSWCTFTRSAHKRWAVVVLKRIGKSPSITRLSFDSRKPACKLWPGPVTQRRRTARSSVCRECEINRHPANTSPSSDQVITSSPLPPKKPQQPYLSPPAARIWLR